MSVNLNEILDERLDAFEKDKIKGRLTKDVIFDIRKIINKKRDNYDK